MTKWSVPAARNFTSVSKMLEGADTIVKPDLASAMNKSIGLPDTHPSAVRFEFGEFVVGKSPNVKSIKDFNAMTPSQRVTFLSDSKTFDGVDTGSTANSIMSKDFGAVKARSMLTARSINLTTPTTKSRIITGLVAKLALVVGGVWTIMKIRSLMESESGCFLTGPDDYRVKVSSDMNMCTCANKTAAPLVRQACCIACKRTQPTLECGETGMSESGYMCPFGGNPPTASRLSLSAASAQSLRRAQVASSPLLGVCADGSCVSCGCDNEDFRLCCVRVDELDVIAGLAASVGKEIMEIGEDAFDFVTSKVGEALSKLTKPLVIGAAVVFAVAAVIALAVIIPKFIKKKSL